MDDDLEVVEAFVARHVSLHFVQALDEILNRHLGPRPVPGRNASWVLIPLIVPQYSSAPVPLASTVLGAINKRRQQKAWRKVGRLARELAQAVRELEVPVFRRIIAESVDKDEGEEWGLDFQDKFWCSVLAFDKTIQKITPSIEKFMEVSPDAGRRGMAAAAIIEGLRDIWKERTGSAPAFGSSMGKPRDDIIQPEDQRHSPHQRRRVFKSRHG